MKSTSRTIFTWARSLRGVGAALAVMLAQPAVASQFSAPDIEVTEGQTATFTITLPHGLHLGIRYAYKTEDNTADAGDDYVATSGNVVWSTGTTVATVSVDTKSDDVSDDGETFKLKLSNLQTTDIRGNWTSSTTDIPSGIPSEATITAEIVE